MAEVNAQVPANCPGAPHDPVRGPARASQRARGAPKHAAARAWVIACAIPAMIAASMPLPGVAAPLSVPDRSMDRYFSIWADNAQISPATVARLYAPRVSYYGRSMTADAVFRDKLAYVRQWPIRRYDVVPGSVDKTCDAGETRCRVTAILRWSKADRSGRHASQGANSISLDLVRDGGALKIARESGSPVVSAACGSSGPGRHCTNFR